MLTWYSNLPFELRQVDPELVTGKMEARYISLQEIVLRNLSAAYFFAKDGLPRVEIIRRIL